MRGPTAAAALLVLSLMLPMTQGVTLSHLFTTRHASPDHSGPARMIRGVPSAARLEPGKREGSKISRRNTESFGPLALLDVCYMADDCTPGLYVGAGFRTQCETTPFSGGDTVCCKPFATPCDSDEACCSGNCDLSHTRCDDAIVPARPMDEEHHDEVAFYSDEVAFYSDEVTSNTPRDSPGDIMADQQDREGGQLDNDGQYRHGKYDDRITGSGLDQYSDDYFGRYSDDQNDYTTTSAEATPRAQDNPLAEDSSTRRSEDPAGFPGNNQDDEKVAGFPPPVDETSGPSPKDDGVHQGGEGEESTVGPLSTSSTEESVPAICQTDYASGTIDTMALSESRVEAVAVDSQGDVFYTVSTSQKAGHAILRAASSPRSGADTNNNVDTDNDDGDTVVYVGTGIILAMAVDADDNLIFTMEDAPAVSGGVFLLSRRQINVGGSGGADGSSSTAVSAYDSYFELPLETDTTKTSAVTLAAGLGPFLPGVAVCPVTGDVYVTRGHTGIARLVKEVDGSFSQKMEWNMVDMAFKDGGKTRAPLMVWDIAVNSIGIVYFTTYVQGVVLKGIFPRLGGAAQVRLVAGKWDSGVSASSGDGGKALSAVLAYPKGIAVDADDNVYVAEFQGEKIRNIFSSGIISTCVGTGRTAYQGDGGPASEAGLDLPNAIAFMPGITGSKMAIADFGHNAVRVVTPISLCP